MGYQTTLSVFWETYVHLESDIEQQTSSKLGKECDKTVFRDPVYLTYM